MARLIVIGASLGGVSALIQLTAALPAGLPAAVLIVLHIGEHKSILPSLLARNCPLPVAHARHGQPIEPGQVWVAPPDHHLLVVDGRIQLGRGAKEHHARPAIDPLFRSAAIGHGPEAIGVVLTGLLDDGTAGLQAIKQCGGICVVQDPAEAFASSMPRSALRHVEVDHCVPLALMPALLASLASSPARPVASPPPDQLRHEQDLIFRKGDPMSHLEAIGNPSTFTCPDCHGALWEILDSRPQRFRCHTGHGFSARTLQHTMMLTSEESGWSALRALQERMLLLNHMARASRANGEEARAAELDLAAARLDHQAAVMTSLLEEDTELVE